MKCGKRDRLKCEFTKDKLKRYIKLDVKKVSTLHEIVMFTSSIFTASIGSFFPFKIRFLFQKHQCAFRESLWGCH